MPRGPARIIPVRTASRAYGVTIGHGLFKSLGEITRRAVGPTATRAAVIADSNLPTGLLSEIDFSLSRAGFFVARLGIEATEEKKSLQSLESVLAFLAAMKLERGAPVVAVGGGIVGDVAGFAAAVHRRGCPVIQCPTTLLAMVDASVGGKTGVNLAIHSGGAGGAGAGVMLLKNAVGAFHQPHAVVADLDALVSLSARQFNAGLAECVKHALIGGGFGEEGLLEWMEIEASKGTSERASKGVSGGTGVAGAWPGDSIAELIERNVMIKAKVVADDEREEASSERGGRAVLNLGHTFAHAIEALPGLAFATAEGTTSGPLLHGEAVALGLVAACRVGVALRLCESDLPARVAALLEALCLPTTVRGLLAADAVLARMGHDKKAAGGVLRLVVPARGRRAVVVEGPAMEVVVAGIGAIRGSL